MYGYTCAMMSATPYHSDDDNEEETMREQIAVLLARIAHLEKENERLNRLVDDQETEIRRVYEQLETSQTE